MSTTPPPGEHPPADGERTGAAGPQRDHRLPAGAAGPAPARTDSASTSAADPADTPSPDDRRAPTVRSRPRRSTVILGAGLAVVVVAAGAGLFWLGSQLAASRAQITDQQQQITDQQREIEEQRATIERKEQFGAAMDELYATVDPLIGLPYASILPWSEVDAFAGRAWAHRETPTALERDISDVKAFTTRLASRVEAARTRAATNATGSPWEAALDTLGRGWVTVAYDDDDRRCDLDAMACVSSADPFVVHVNAETRDDTKLTDWIRTGAAYHEYAHVLQFTNPEATASALTAFDGDVETMADCYALTFLDGWSLDHEVPIDAFSYWEVSVGYGYTCNEGQRQVIREWVSGLGLQKQTISQ